MSWYRTAMLSLLNIIKMQENGLNIPSMSFEELKEAKELEKEGIIKKIVKTDDGKYTAYVINEDYTPDFEESKSYIENLKLDNLVEKIAKGHKDWTPEELQLQQNHSKELERRLKEKVATFNLDGYKTAQKHDNYLEVGNTNSKDCYMWARIKGRFLVNKGCGRDHFQVWPELLDTDYRGRFEQRTVSVVNPFIMRDLPNSLYRQIYDAFGDKVKIVEFS